MKSVLKLVFLIFITVSYFGCEDDSMDMEENIQEQTSRFTLEGIDYELNSALIVTSRDDNNTSPYWYSMTFFSDGIGYNSNESRIEGIGNIVIFEGIYSPLSNNLAEGRYLKVDCASLAEDIEFTFDCSRVALNYDSNIDDADYLQDVTNGVVNISRMGSAYEVTFELELENSDNINAVFIGEIEFVEI